MNDEAKPTTKRPQRDTTDQRLNLWVSADLHHALRQRTVDENTTITSIVETTLRQAFGMPPLPPRPTGASKREK